MRLRTDGFQTHAKPDASPVTPADLASQSRQPISQADLASHEMLARALDAACPGMPLISEEDVESPARDEPSAFFLIDPLDATREFCARRECFTINVDPAVRAGLAGIPPVDRADTNPPGSLTASERPSILRGLNKAGSGRLPRLPWFVGRQA